MDRDFKQDPEDPGKKERYQAEALIWKEVPLDALLAVCCYSPAVKSRVESQIAESGKALTTLVQTSWYF